MREKAGALVVALAPLAVYALTLQNGLTLGELQGGDVITHHYAQATARFANAPGYPIYTMLGWLWFQASAVLSPLLNPVARLSFYSTLYAVPSLVLLHWLLLEAQRGAPTPALPRPARRLTLRVKRQDAGQGREQAAVSHVLPHAADAARQGREVDLAAVGIAVAATLFFAFTYFFWYYAVAAENYSSGVLNTLVIIALAFRWQKRRDTPTLLWLAFACGLSLAHLLTVALAVPAVIAFVVGQPRDLLRRPKLLIQVATVTFLPLLSYAYVYWRGAEHPEWRGAGNWASAWAWFTDFLTTKQGQGELTWSWDGIPWQALGLIASELTLPVLIGGLAGLCLLPRSRAVLLLGIVALYAPFIYIDRYGNWFQAIIPLYPVFVIGAVALADRARVFVREWTRINANRKQIERIVTVAAIAVFVMQAGERFAANYARANLRDRAEATGLAPGWALLADEPARGARIAGTQDEALALDYLTRIWGARSDVSAVGIKDAPRYLGEPLYASRAAMPLTAPLLPPEARLSTQGAGLIALKRTADTRLPEGVTAVGKAMAGGVELAGYTALRQVLRQAQDKAQGAAWRVTLYWRAARTPERDMAVSVRLMSGGRELAQADSAHPVGGWYPFTRWQAGEVVRDDYALPVQDGAAVDAMRVILYHAEGAVLVNDAVMEVGVR